MIPSPISKALSTIRRHQVAHLLMGGQACVLYGAAEVIAVPPFDLKHLAEGLAVHFRCKHPEAAGLRIVVLVIVVLLSG